MVALSVKTAAAISISTNAIHVAGLITAPTWCLMATEKRGKSIGVSMELNTFSADTTVLGEAEAIENSKAMPININLLGAEPSQNLLAGETQQLQL